MADWSMEPQVFIPCNFQQADWSLESALWVPGLPVSCEPESTEMTCLEETFVPASSSRGQQMLRNAPKPIITDGTVIRQFQIDSDELQGDITLFVDKMYRYPPVIRGLTERYTVPTVVSIGPYHRDRALRGGPLNEAEEAKCMAAYKCIRDSGISSVEPMYDAVTSVVYHARSLYDKEKMRGILDDEFLPMMFFDACFLVQFMIAYAKPDDEMPKDNVWLSSYFDRNCFDILHDVLLLQNQVPWIVVQTIMWFTPDINMHLQGFVSKLQGCLQDRQDLEISTDVLDGVTRPPHLLGLFQMCIVGSNESSVGDLIKPSSVSAIELAKIGITLAPNKTTEPAKVSRINIRESRLTAELEMAPLSLNHLCASVLVNMAALELCLPHHFTIGGIEKYAVCSYLRLLAMLMDRGEDVHELRAKNVLHGGGLTNKEVLHFFSTLQCLRPGPLYYRTLQKIETYRQDRPLRVKGYAFLYKYLKKILVAFSVVTGLSGITGMFITALKKGS